jgi:hypothetical protein
MALILSARFGVAALATRIQEVSRSSLCSLTGLRLAKGVIKNGVAGNAKPARRLM